MKIHAFPLPFTQLQLFPQRKTLLPSGVRPFGIDQPYVTLLQWPTVININ